MKTQFKKENVEKSEKAEKAKETRSEILRFRVTPEERTKIEHKALSSYRTVSTYLRDCALGKSIVVIPYVDSLISELRRLGNNLNQIARAVNSGYASVTGRGGFENGSNNNRNDTVSPELSEIQKGVKQIWQSLNSLCRDAR